jgi:threonine dehydrogenase-like Zn-dependent dehydrogenase
MLVAVYEDRRIEFNTYRSLNPEIDIISCFWWRQIDFRRAADLITSGQVDVRPLITGRIARGVSRPAYFVK